MARTIAVIEDDLDYQEVLAEILKKAGYEVYTAVSGYEIVMDIINRKPDLILVDLMLPAVTGDKVIEAFRKKNIIEEIPVILISSKDEPEIKKVAENISAVAYLKKPVDSEKLIEIINRYIR